jgi:hypothetical protein
MQQLCPYTWSGTLLAPVLLMLECLFPAPPGSWNEGSLALLTELLRAAVADLRIQEALDGGLLGDGTTMRVTYCRELAALLPSIAREAAQAPLLAATLARCGFGQLGLQLTRAGVPGVTPSPPWVRDCRPASSLALRGGICSPAGSCFCRLPCCCAGPRTCCSLKGNTPSIAQAMQTFEALLAWVGACTRPWKN